MVKMLSLVSLLERDDEGHECGYCKNAKGSISDGMWAHRLTCIDYQLLIDRGYRRSGQYLYKMNMCKTCCPAYTIKCDALNFKPARSQKKVMKAMTKYLTMPEVMTVAKETAASTSADDTGDRGATVAVAAAAAAASSGAQSTSGNWHQGKLHPPRPGAGADPDRPPCRKAKDVRKERKAMKKVGGAEGEGGKPSEGRAVLAVGSDGGKPPEANSPFKTIEQLAVETLPGKEPVHRLTTALVPSDPKDPVFEATRRDSFALYAKYQTRVHKDKPEDITTKKWERFLVESPLQRKEAAPGIEYGSFHRHYYIDGKLVAVGVMDILPNALSSVYLYYDPDLPQLSLGTYTALCEIMLTRELVKSLPELKWYYMGFYIHDCPKMRYKGNYSPSLLLCPEAMTWHPIEQCVPKLDVSKYSRFSPGGSDDATGAGAGAEWEIMRRIPVVLPNNSGLATYEVYERRFGRRSRKMVETYVVLVGKEIAQQIVLIM